MKYDNVNLLQKSQKIQTSHFDNKMLSNDFLISFDILYNKYYLNDIVNNNKISFWYDFENHFDIVTVYQIQYCFDI
ncbi:uncharacterized protein OCT59_016107 [Rhizophagus irregularis]|uniref:uncharacterized protein n=1 Tax=Rhizophagus irregularis TaxID=588596 RepID=UPI0033312C1D|nr:hypothetical protein OCT59_016107 [Rhizophagus irregularis]